MAKIVDTGATASSPELSTMKRAARIYFRMAALFFNVTLAAILLNAAASLVLRGIDRPSPSSNPLALRYGPEAAEKAIPRIYPDLDRHAVDKLLQEMWGRPVQFHPFALFKERPFRGQYVNVHEAGFRFSHAQGPWPPSSSNVNIFVFGGSTTFGYGVPDWQTIPSHLQEALRRKRRDSRICVYNFGTNSYYSSLERNLFVSLIIDGYRPDIAVFIDGLNEFFYIDNTPKYSQQLSDLLDLAVGQKAAPSPWFGVVKSLPLIRLMEAALARRQITDRWATGDPNLLTQEDVAYFDDRRVIDKVIETYRRNKRLIEAVASRLGVTTLFVWQPVPSYGLDLRRHPFPKDCKKMYSAFGYPVVRELYERGDLGTNFLWAADLQTTAPDPLYVDMVHYSSRFCGVLAEHIADALVKQWPDPPGAR